MSIKDFFDMFTVEEITILCQLFAMFFGVQFGSCILICISAVLSYHTAMYKHDFHIMQRRARRLKKRREELVRTGVIRNEN